MRRNWLFGTEGMLCYTALSGSVNERGAFEEEPDAFVADVHHLESFLLDCSHAHVERGRAGARREKRLNDARVRVPRRRRARVSTEFARR